MKIAEPTAKDVKEWRAWVRSLPPKPRAVAERFEPWRLYRLKDTGDRVTFYSVADDGTLTVVVSGAFNVVVFDRRVFGIDPDNLEECDLPGPNELVGTLLTPDQVNDNLDAVRCAVRPDLWVMDENGKAVRKQ